MNPRPPNKDRKLIRLTPEQFQMAMSVAHMREGSIRTEAARRVLVEGESLADVKRDVGGAAYQGVDKILAGHQKHLDRMMSVPEFSLIAKQLGLQPTADSTIGAMAVLTQGMTEQDAKREYGQYVGLVLLQIEKFRKK